MLCAAMIFSAGCSEKTTMSSQKTQVEIEFSWWGNDARNRYTLKAVELFEELHPEIRVKCSYSEWSGYEKRNKIWMASDTEADVMQINYGWLTDYSADGMGYYDLNALSKYIDLSNFTEEQLSYGTRNGVLNALPIAMNSEMVYINKTIYDRYGADVPKTWDDLFRAADAMRSANIYPLSASSKSMWLYLISYAEQAQGKSILDQNGSLNFTEKDFAVMMDFYKKLVDSKVMPLVEHYERIKLDNENYAGSVAWVSDAESYFGYVSLVATLQYLAGDVQSVVPDELAGALSGVLVQLTRQQATAHAYLLAELRHVEFRVHVVLLHDAHDALHERLRVLHPLLGIRLHALLRALAVAFLVVQYALYALLQLLRVLAFAQYLLDGAHQPFRLLLLGQLQLPLPAALHLPEQVADSCHEGDGHQQAEPPALPEVGLHVHVDADSRTLCVVQSRGIRHLERVVAIGQAGVSHAVLARG